LISASFYFKEKQFITTNQYEIDKSSDIVAEAVWTLYIDASESYLSQIVRERNYKNLEIVDTDEKPMLSIKAEPLSGVDSLLIKLNLIKVVPFSSIIKYKDEHIGFIKADVYNKLVYDQLNTSLIFFLILISVWFSIKLYESKLELEDRVKERTRELRQSEAKYLTLFNNNHSVMLLIDPSNGAIVDANPAAVNYYGYSKKELLNKKTFEINTAPKEYVKEQMEKAITKESSVFNMRHRLASGEIRDIEIYSGPIKYQGKNYIFAIMHDVTARKETERKLNNLNKSLQQKIEYEIEKNRKQEEIIHNQKKLVDMGNMINAISHQWRQPLNAIGLYIQDITDAFESGELDLEYLQKFEEESMDIVQHLSNTIDDFRYFYMPDKEPVDMKVMEEILSLLRLTMAQLQNNHIKVRLICKCKEKDLNFNDIVNDEIKCGCIDTVIRGYKGEFKQVIANLIYNSIDAINSYRSKCPECGNIDVSVEVRQDRIIISVTDDGGGIPDDIAGRIFDPYFTTKNDTKGTGIGLYMSKTIIENHMKGHLWFENLDSGVSFTLELPMNGELSP
jgi:PAS domain S-box-containing protein